MLPLVQFAAPFIHKKFLEFHRNGADLAGKPLMNPAREVAAEEPHVLAHIQAAAEEVEATQIGLEPLDDDRPRRTIEAPGANIDFGVLRRIGGRAIYSVPAMVVAVQVEHNDAAVQIDEFA